MGIYSATVNESTKVYNELIIECNMNDIYGVNEAALNIVAEAEDNYARLMKCVGIEELVCYESTGELMVYSEEAGKGFIAKVKEFFMNLLAKIRGLFKKFMAMFDSYVKGDKEFAKKYKKDLMTITKSLKDFKYNGYNFTIEGKPSVQDVFNKLNSYTTAPADYDAAVRARTDAEDTYETMRGAVISGSGTLTASEFSKELFAHFRDGQNSKEDIENVDVTKILRELEGVDKWKSDLNKELSAFEKATNKVIKDLEKEQNDLVKTAPTNTNASQDITILSVQVQFARKAFEIAQAYNAARMTAIKDNARQNKAIASALLRYNPKNESTTEPQFNYSEDTSFLSGLTFK